MASDGKWYPPEKGVGVVPPPSSEYRDPSLPDPEEEERERKKKATELPSFHAVIPEETRTPAPVVATGYRNITVDEDRLIEVLDSGPEGAVPLFFHPGTPFSAQVWLAAADTAERLGLRLVTWSRAGYGGSSRRVGRSVADTLEETDAALELLGADRFVVMGWSSGGPYALACAALLGGRCLAAAAVSTLAPYDAAGLDWYAGMSRSRVEEAVMAHHGGTILERYLDERASAMTLGTPSSVELALGGPLPPVDVAVLAEPLGEPLVQSLRSGVAIGSGGWFDDDVALMSDWHFDPGSIQVPVTLWRGAEDPLVPAAHTTWLASHIPGARAFEAPGEGHVSVLVRQLDAIVEGLVSSSGLGA